MPESSLSLLVKDAIRAALCSRYAGRPLATEEAVEICCHTERIYQAIHGRVRGNRPETFLWSVPDKKLMLTALYSRQCRGLEGRN